MMETMKDEIVRRYVERKQTLHFIAFALSMSPRTVLSALEERGIARRVRGHNFNLSQYRRIA